MFMEDGIGELSMLPNIGKTVEEQLIKVCINTPDELRTVGAKTAWLKIQYKSTYGIRRSHPRH